MQRHSFYTYARDTCSACNCVCNHDFTGATAPGMHRDTHVPAQGEVSPMPNPMVPDCPPPITWDICPFTQHGHHDTKPLLQHLCCSFPLGCVLFAACQPKPHSPTLCNGGGAAGACSQLSPDHVGVTCGAVKDEERGVVPGSVPTCDAHTSVVQPRVGQPYRCSVWGCRTTLHTSPWAVNP